MKKLQAWIYVGFCLLVACGDNSGIPTNVSTGPHLNKLECDHYIFVINKDNSSTKEDIVIFFNTISVTSGFSEIKVISANSELNGSIVVTADSVNGKGMERSEALSMVASLSGAGVQCDEAVPPAR